MITEQKYGSQQPRATTAPQTSPAVKTYQQRLKYEAEQAREELVLLVDGFQSERSIGRCVELLLDASYNTLQDRAGLDPERDYDPHRQITLRENNLDELWSSFQIIKFLVNLHVVHDRIGTIEEQIMADQKHNPEP